MSPAERRTIAVWGHYHGGNLGDETVVATMILAIRSRQPDARIIAISLAPEDTERRHGVAAFPISPSASTGGYAAGSPRPSPGIRAVPGLGALRRVPGLRALVRGARIAPTVVREVRFSFRAYRLLRGIDTLVVAGSGQLTDTWGPWHHPFAAWRWGRLARIARTELILPSVGAGPIRKRTSAAFIRSVLASAAYISLREAGAERVLREIGVTRQLPFCPDMGWAARLPDPPAPPEPGRRIRVGMNVMAHQDPRYLPPADIRRYHAYVANVAALVARLLEQKCDVVLFSSQTRADTLVADDVSASLAQQGLDGHPRLSSQFGGIEETDDLLEALATFDYVVASRFHTVLFALALGIPTLVLAHHGKTTDLLAQLGQSSESFDIDAFEPKELHDALTLLRASDTPACREERRNSAMQQREAVEAQFDALFGKESE